MEVRLHLFEDRTRGQLLQWNLGELLRRSSNLCGLLPDDCTGAVEIVVFHHRLQKMP
jgi:hypothetical protein